MSDGVPSRVKSEHSTQKRECFYGYDGQEIAFTRPLRPLAGVRFDASSL